jgi:hypothetical protein
VCLLVEECLSPTPFKFSISLYFSKSLREERKEREREKLRSLLPLFCSALLRSVPMERHRCKLCSRTFANGRALGGHMKAHLATLPLPPKPQQQQQQLADRSESASSSSSSSGEEQEDGEAEEKALGYGLRENPKKSFRLADPEFSFAVDAGSVVQDRESETESKNPTRRRSKRNRKPGVVGESPSSPNLELMKKAKLTKPSSSESPEAMSSVSDTSPEEDVAMCLMMLSRDIRMRRNNGEQDQERGKQVQRSIKIKEPEEPEEIKIRRVRGKHRCEKCRKTFRSYQALGSHKTICYRDEAGHDGNERIFECPFCDKVFGSGQALGGHKRSHLLGSSATAAANAAAASASASAAASSSKFEISVIDLNLPAPAEEDDFSVVSDA